MVGACNMYTSVPGSFHTMFVRFVYDIAVSNSCFLVAAYYSIV